MAKNRIASLASAGAPATAQVPEKVASAEPVAPQDKGWKAEIGTAETEKALNLTLAEQKEIQQRLIALDLYKGPATGAVDSPTRSALTDWQKSRGVAPTSFLGSMQWAELRAESESAFQKSLAAQSAPRETPRQAVKPAPKPVTRAAKAVAPAPVRHVTKRSTPASAATAAAAPSAPADPGGTPAWRHRAGLPDNTGGDGGNAAAGFMTGAAAGFMLGRFRHY